MRRRTLQALLRKRVRARKVSKVSPVVKYALGQSGAKTKINGADCAATRARTQPPPDARSISAIKLQSAHRLRARAAPSKQSALCKHRTRPLPRQRICKSCPDRFVITLPVTGLTWRL